MDTGLTPPQYRLLMLLADGTERSTALAQRLAVSKPAISAAVETLTVAGHVRRRSDESDRRITWLEITPVGEAALSLADDALVTRFDEVLKELDDPAVMLSALTDLDRAMEKNREERRRAQQS
ncbi:MarR family transcriptional regulator [Microlunatus speluncae]|uniref:MarR family transcriptional regulator n=1 Tax=Microlunatus speluncae TaxID=2594267 RepID=UPI001375E514|nr:MarR family transcriptional regulator [Microlunatus speluncae]